MQGQIILKKSGHWFVNVCVSIHSKKLPVLDPGPLGGLCTLIYRMYFKL